jgi:hypothetical protein
MMIDIMISVNSTSVTIGDIPETQLITEINEKLINITDTLHQGEITNHKIGPKILIVIVTETETHETVDSIAGETAINKMTDTETVVIVDIIAIITIVIANMITGAYRIIISPLIEAEEEEACHEAITFL